MRRRFNRETWQRAGVLVGWVVLHTLGLTCRFSTPPTPHPDDLELAVQETSTALALTQAVIEQPTLPCPIPPDHPPLPDLTDIRAAAAALTGYLNAGGSVDRLQTLVNAQGIASLQGRFFATADVNGDRFEDLLVSVVASESNISAPPGTLFLFVCRETDYLIAYTTPDFPDLSVPVIHAAADLNGDSQAEGLIGRWTCGAHTCFETLEALVWSDGTMRDLLQGSSNDLPTPIVKVETPLEGEPSLISVTGTAINSVGAGPFRPITRTWTWSPEQGAFVVVAEAFEPSDYRIHRLHAADQFAREGDHAAALNLYNEIISGEGLLDWVDPEVERANLAAFARFRIVVTLLRLGDPNGAGAAYQQLVQSVPEGSTGAAYADLAEAFWTEYEASGDLVRACSAAQAYTLTHTAEVLEPLYFGYANPSYSAADVCPAVGG